MNATDELIESRTTGRMDGPIELPMDHETVSGVADSFRERMQNGELEIIMTIRTRNGWCPSGRLTSIYFLGKTTTIEAISLDGIRIALTEIVHIKESASIAQ